MTPSSPLEGCKSQVLRAEKDVLQLRPGGLTRAVSNSCLNLHKQGVPLPIYPHAICPNPRTGYHEREGDTGRESGIAELRSLLNNNNPSVDSPQTRADCCFLSCSPPCRSSNPLGSVHHTSWAKTAKVASLSNLEVLESLHGSSLPNSTFMLPSSLPRPTTNYLGTSPAETTGVF